MCGIAGYVSGPDPRPLGKFQASVLDSIAHRGPDDAGWYIDGLAGTGQPPPEAGRVGLFHRRLSILDLSPLGHQPMTTADGRLAITYNGEVYNYLELRAGLERQGAVFRSQSDTEVVLQAYARQAEASLAGLVGMFALAIVDRDRKRMILARDPFGIKPLYYTTTPGGFAFASEIKALRPIVSPRVNASRLQSYLWDGLLDSGDQTLLADVRQLPAASWMSVDLETGVPSSPQRYWRIDPHRRLDLSFSEAVRRARELFFDSVRLHLRSDVPVGAALSGGIDSSAIVAAMRAVEPKADLRTFSFVTDEPGMNEEPFADLAAARAGAVARKVRLGPGDLMADLDRLVATQDEPFGSTSIYAQYRVFRLAAESGVKVMLDGQGADEMLAGYHGYFADRMGTLLQRGRLLEAYRFASRASKRPGIEGRGRLFARGLKRLLPPRLVPRPAPPWLNLDWFRERGVPAIEYGTPRSRDCLRDRLIRTLEDTSLPMLLRYEDRNSMAWSIESRVPFLTPALAEFFLGLPEEYLISREGVTKHVFREAMRDIVPGEILDRRDKVGFATPEKRWLGELGPWVADVLRPERLSEIPVLNAVRVADVWRRTRDGTRPFDWRIWRWVNLVRWAENWGAEFA